MTTKQIKHHGVHLAVGLALVAMCGASQGLGLGQGSSPVTMGEGLSFDAPLRLAPGERLDDDCLSADVYFGEDKVAGFKVAVTLSQDRQGEPAIHVATSSRVTEPVVTVYVAAGCSSHITRKYVVLADPPGMPTPAGLPVAGEWVTAAADAPVVAPPRPRWARAEAPSPSGRAHRGKGPASAGQGGASARASRQNPPPVFAAARLRIDPVAADALVAPTLRMGNTLSLPTDWGADSPALRARRAMAAAYWRALQTVPENWAQDQARLAELERRVLDLQSLRDQLAVARQASAVASASQAGAPRFARNEDEVQRIRTVGLIGVALFGLVAYGRMRWRDREASADVQPNWWQGWQEGARAATPPPADGPAATSSSHGAPAPGWARSGASDLADSHLARVATVDELIDLAQQVELFVLLGQDDAAEALLEDHVRQTVGGSPMPFLMLLALHHRRQQRPGYERTRQAFDARFGAPAPAWAHAERLQGPPLAELPTTWRQLQSARTQPEQARAWLAQLIGQPPEAGADRLGLLAYKDLLDIYNELGEAAAERDLATSRGVSQGARAQGLTSMV